MFCYGRGDTLPAVQDVIGILAFNAFRLVFLLAFNRRSVEGSEGDDGAASVDNGDRQRIGVLLVVPCRLPSLLQGWDGGDSCSLAARSQLFSAEALVSQVSPASYEVIVSHHHDNHYPMW